MGKNIYIYSNKTSNSNQTESTLRSKLDRSGYRILDDLTPEADLMVCIGVDGTFLEAIH